MKKRIGRRVWTLALLALLLPAETDFQGISLTSTIQAQDGKQEIRDAESNKIKSVLFKKVNNTRMGIWSTEAFTLTKTDAKYTLAYSCKGWRCDCKKSEEREVETAIAEEFFRDIGNLKDLGQEAACCDRAWTGMTISYSDGSSKILVVVGYVGAAGVKIFNFKKACASAESELRSSVADRKIPAGLVITYDDMHPLWGGTTIIIRGNGEIERRVRSRKESKASVTHATIGQSRLLKFIEQLITLNAWEQHTPDRQPFADENRATLTINVDGQTSKSWEWFNELSKNNRLVQVREKMLALNKKRLIKDRPQVGR